MQVCGEGLRLGVLQDWTPWVSVSPLPGVKAGPQLTEAAWPGDARGASSANDQEQLGVGPSCPFLYTIFSIISTHDFI